MRDVSLLRPAIRALASSRRRTLATPGRPGWVAVVLVALLGLVGLMPGVATPVQAQATRVTMLLDSAEFRLEGEPGWRAVALPDTWSHRRVAQGPDGPVGHYRLDVHMATVPVQMWALHFERLSVMHEVRLNGQLIHGNRDLPRVAQRPVPTLITVPPALWRAGPNRLDITVDGGPGNGLSPVRVGPETDLTGGFLWSHHQTTTLAQVLNAASASISVFMLMIWWRRRQEVALGCFALLSLLAAARNFSYFMVGGYLPAAYTSAAYFLLQVGTVLLLAVFAMAYAGRQPWALRRLSQAIAAAAPVLAIVGIALDRLQAVRAWTYPVLMLVVLAALVLVFQRARERRHSTDALLVATLAAVLGVGVHDYLFQQGHTSVMDRFWMPFVVPLLTAAFSIALLDRVVQALRDSESLNVTLEQRVAERTRDLEQANQAKSRFLAAASHDLRQPLVGIGLLVALLRDHPHTPAVARVVVRLVEATRAMEDLFRRLLDLSRLESETLMVRRVSVRLQGIFDAIEVHLRESAAQKGLRLRIRATDAQIDSDPLLLEQILRNLVTNAVHHSERGGVLVAARPDGADHLRLEVWDTGPGIAADQQSRLFEASERLHPGATSGVDKLGAFGLERGLGMGLAIARRCAALLGTAIDLQSQPGQGSRFSVRVPRACSTTATPAASRGPHR